MFAETAALRLGTTVANTAARLWLGSKRWEQERRLPIEELARLRVPGVKFHRSVKRQFEQIADAVFDRVEPFLDHEFRGLDESGRLAVIDAVCDTFERADLSGEALPAANAEPAELIRRITGSVSAPVGLNEPETRLYERLFAECCEYYVRIVRSLPVFEERATTELPARSATLGGEVARILERLPDRSLLAPDGTDQDTAFRRRYLELVSEDLDEVELFRRASDRAAAQVRLSVAYVSLRATGADGTRRRTARSLPRLRTDMSDWEEPGGEGAGMRVESALGGASRGPAARRGGLRQDHLAAPAGRHGGPRGLHRGAGGLERPHAGLRQAARVQRPGAADAGGHARRSRGAPHRHHAQGLGETAARLRQGTAPHRRRGRTARPRAACGTGLAAHTAADVRRCTCGGHLPPGGGRRGLAAPGGLHRPASGPDDTAGPGGVRTAVAPGGTGVGDELPRPADELPRYEQSLLTSLKDRPHLQPLAGTPLLAAMLCAMHLNRGGQLPRDRMELYRNALHTLVHDRDADRNVPSAADSKLSLGDKLVVLQDLAWRLSDNNRSEIALEQAAVHVGARLTAMRHLDGPDGEEVLKQLRDRSGMLRSPAQGRLDFVHRTFQEYLAAEEAAEEDRMGNLVGRAHLDLWRETITMAAGHANTRQREELLTGILDRAQEEPRHARTLRLLAASCQETLPSVSEGLADRLEEGVTRLLPTRRKTDPPALAAVGPSLLRKMPRSLGELTEKAAAQTVRTVALIGDEEALGLLAGYVGDERGDVVDELIGAWDYFDADAYADQVMARLPLENRIVRLTYPGQWRAVPRLRSLTSLSISYPFTEFAALVELPPLKDLAIFELRGEADLSALRTQPTLTDVGLYGDMSMKHLEGLGELRQLRLLFLGLSGTPDLDGLRLGPERTSMVSTSPRG